MTTRRRKADPLLTTAEVAAAIGWASTAAVRTAVRTGHFPQPDDQGDPAVAINRRQKRWLTSTITAYLAARPGQGYRTDLKESA